MERTYLNRYRLCLDRVGLPIVLRRSADEATLRADDIQSGAQVAVQLVPAPSLGAMDREQLEAEARGAQQIDHINIPRLRDFGFDDDQLVYVTEYIEGITAEEWIKTKGPMPVGAVLRVASQMVSALVTASLHGVIHYAVYPANILLSPGETANGEWPLIKVVNFLGVAPSLAPSNGHGPESLNPAAFASPEQLSDGPVTFRSEIYSLGCALWYLLKGVPPAGGAAALEYAIGVPAPVRQLLAGMLAENPADRPSDPLVLQQQIQACVAQIERQDVDASKWGMPVALTPVAANETETSSRRRAAWKSLALAAILVAIATLTAVILTQRPHQNRGLETTSSALEAPALPLPNAARLTENSLAKKETEATAAPSNLASDLPVADAKNEESSSANVASSSTGLSSEPIPVATPKIEMMLDVLPNQESIERPAPVIAKESPAPEPEMAARETALVRLATMPEPLPPAEGFIENEKPIVEISPPTTAAEEENAEEERKDIPVTSAPTAPKKNSKPGHPPKPTSKKTVTASLSRNQPLLRDLPRQYPAPIVGHIFPPSWPATDVNELASPPSRSEERPLPHRSSHVPAKKKAPASPASPPA